MNSMNLKIFQKNGRVGQGNYSSALLHCLLENPVLPTAVAAFKLHTEGEADKKLFVFHVHLLAGMKLHLPYRQHSIICNTLCSNIMYLTSGEQEGKL